MYQGKNPTAHTSQKLILDAMNLLLTEKEFKDISVSELSCRSGVSRQTFYSLFGKKENDLTDVLYTLIYQSMASCRQSFVNLDDTTREYAAQFMAAGLSRLTQKYVLEHEKPDQDELARLSYKIMSGNIYQT